MKLNLIKDYKKVVLSEHCNKIKIFKINNNYKCQTIEVIVIKELLLNKNSNKNN